MKAFTTRFYLSLYHPGVQTFLKLAVIVVLLLVNKHAFADTPSPVDLLAGTSGDATKTLNGTGKTFLYLIEGVLGVVAYIKTKNLLSLVGVLVVAIFINDILSTLVTPAS